MKIILYSDLHLEFGKKFKPPSDRDADLMILAGDIVTFNNLDPLTDFLSEWEKPVLYVAGNHEYYSKKPKSIDLYNKLFQEYICNSTKEIVWLRDSCYSFDDYEFFGGTMWTDFKDSDIDAMRYAKYNMNDYRMIWNEGRNLMPGDTIGFHEEFKGKLVSFLRRNREKKKVIISHHAPVINPKSIHKGSYLEPAFNASDIEEIIKRYKPNYWFYGHTHECDNQIVGRTQIISNQSGYPKINGEYECKGFNPEGAINLSS